MYGAGAGAEFLKRAEDGAVVGTAGVEHDLPAPLFAAHSRQGKSDLAKGIVGSGDEYYIRAENLVGKGAVRGACADLTDGGAGGGARPGNDGTDLPAKLAEAPSEGLPDTTRAYNRNCPLSPHMVG